MTPRSAASRNPGTAFDLDKAVADMRKVLPQVVVEIERLARAEAATAAVLTAADAWQAGYEACWNRLKDAGRLLPSDGAAVPLDVERLRNASQAHRSTESKAWAAKGEYHVTHMCGDGDCWDKIAAEYARLSADEEGGTTRNHYNPARDGFPE